ncbi:MAG TPA: hypothetical protein VIA82_10285 [Candidatus Limnocylindria bacterium]
MAIKTDRSVVKVCPAARVGGTLVTDDEWGLTLENPGTGRHRVTWPHGYSARRESGVVYLVDDRGEVIAREGDHIHAGGASDDDGTAHVCFGITVDVPAGT